MKFLRKFNEHASYEAELNVGGGLDISSPNVSYCEDVKDVHYTPYNLVRFYVGEITGTTPQTVKIYTDSNTSVDIQVSEGEGNKWYSYVLPKYKGLYNIEGDSVKKVIIKADISFEGAYSYPYLVIIPSSVVDASFKGSNTSNVTDMSGMFWNCRGLTSLDVSGWDTSKVTHMNYMFYGCTSLTSLDLRNFNTSNVTDMGSMFDGCTSLTSLDLRNFNTSNVTDMGSMFDGCSGLTSLDLSGWDTSKVNLMGLMFNGCSNSLKIRMVGCSPETVTKIQNQLTADGITGAQITTK